MDHYQKQTKYRFIEMKSGCILHDRARFKGKFRRRPPFLKAFCNRLRLGNLHAKVHQNLFIQVYLTRYPIKLNKKDDINEFIVLSK